MSLTRPDTLSKLYGAPCAVLDFETTWDGDSVPGEYAGRFYAERHFPVEAAVLHGRVGIPDFEVVVDRRYCPPIAMHPEATAVHGITDDDVIDCDPFDRVAVGEILDAIEGRILVAYNLPFDWSILADSASELGLGEVPFFGLDPLVFARLLEPPRHSCALYRVMRRRGRVHWAHGAKADADATGWYLSVALRELLRRDLWEPEHLANFANAWKAQVDEAIAWERAAAAREMYAGRLALYWTELTGGGGE